MQFLVAVAVVTTASVERDHPRYSMPWEVLGWLALAMIALPWFNGLVLRRQQVAPRLHAKGGQHALRHLAHARHLPAAQGSMLRLMHLGQRYRGMKCRGHLQHCQSCSSRPAYPPHRTPCHRIWLTGEAGHA